MRKKSKSIITEEERKTQDINSVKDYEGEKSNSAKYVEAMVTDDYDETPAVDNSLEGRASNVWYHYKWHIIIGAFFLLVAFIGISQMTGNEKYEMSVLYTGRAVISGENKNNFSSSLRDIMKNSSELETKNGVKLYTYNYFSDEQIEERKKLGASIDYQANVDALENFKNMVFVGDCGVMFLDYDLFVTVRDSGGLVTLEDALGYRPENSLDEYGVPLSALDAYEFYKGLQIMPDDTVICLRGVSTAGGVFTKKKSAEKNYEKSRALFREIFAFTLPEGYIGEGE